MDVYVASAAPDAALAVDAAHLFERRGWLVTWDGGMGPGDPFTAEAAIARAGCTVVLWSGDAKYSHAVAQAAAAAQERGTLVGVRLDASSPPYEFRKSAGVDLSGWEPGHVHAGVDALLTLVAAALRLGPRSYRLPVRARLDLQAWVLIRLLRRRRMADRRFLLTMIGDAFRQVAETGLR